jgi:hypothetical protein
MTSWSLRKLSAREPAQLTRAVSEWAIHLQRDEPECLVLHEGAADVAAQLIACVGAGEGACSRGIGRRREVERGIVQGVTERPVHDVRAAFRGRRHLAAGELAAAHIVRVRDDACVAHGFGGDTSFAERQAVERDLVLVRPLAGHRESRSGAVGARNADGARRERGNGIEVTRVDGQSPR